MNSAGTSRRVTLAAALALLDEMDEMSKDDKIQKIVSFMRVLLVHMIKQAVEHRTTKSWEVSIRHALRQIAAVNTRRKAGGWYMSEEELRTLLEGVYESALDWASLEAHEGIYSASELAAMHERSQLLAEAFEKIQQAHG